MKLSEHPSVKDYHAQNVVPANVNRPSYEMLKTLCLAEGADDFGVISLDHEAIKDQRDEILAVFPKTRAIISIVAQLNKDNIRCPDRSVSDFEYLQGFEKMASVSRQIVRKLNLLGVRAVNPSIGFPMDMSKWPEKMWSISHKPIAVAAGLGVMGHHRLVAHPKYGSFILLGSILIDCQPNEFSQPLDFDPCLNCRLCVTACPVGAVSKNGHFNFANCMTHNYRDRVGGFSNWVENVVSSHNAKEYRQKVSDSETVSVWQSLSYGICNKSSYCMAVCPAGTDVLGDYLEDKKQFKESVVDPLKNKTETIYVVPGSDAQAHVTRRFPHKTARLIGNGLRPNSVEGFLGALPLVFQPNQAKDLNAIYHFTFLGNEKLKGTVEIRNKTVSTHPGHVGNPDLEITADSDAWLKFLAKEGHIVKYLITRKIRIKGSPKLMKQFADCFPA